MWFLIKGTFWFSLVLVLLPFLDPSTSEKLEKGPTVAVGDTIDAASEAVTYLADMCVKKPDVCQKGAETFVALGHRAREGARIAYQFLDTQFADETGKVAETDQKPIDLKQALAQKLPAVATIDADDEIITGTIAVPTRRPEH